MHDTEKILVAREALELIYGKTEDILEVLQCMAMLTDISNITPKLIEVVGGYPYRFSASTVSRTGELYEAYATKPMINVEYMQACRYRFLEARVFQKGSGFHLHPVTVTSESFAGSIDNEIKGMMNA